MAAAATVLLLTAPVALASGEGLIPEDAFQVDHAVQTPLAKFLGQILAQFLFIVFEVSVVAAVFLLGVQLVLLMIGKRQRGELLNDLTNKALAIFLMVVILSGGASFALNVMTQSAVKTVQTVRDGIQNETGASGGGGN